MTRKHTPATYSRREFGQLTLAALPAAALISGTDLFEDSLAAQGKPNSVFGGVAIGVIAPYSFGQEAADVNSVLRGLVALGVSRVELQSNTVEAYAGAPPPAPVPAATGRAASAAEQVGSQQAAAAQLARWRTSVSPDRFKVLRKLYNTAGVSIDAFRITLTESMADTELDYAFTAAKALGAGQVTMELSPDAVLTKRLGDAAARHKMIIGYHAHLQATLTAWDEATAQSPANGLQVDIGHYVAGTSDSPVPLITKHASRIASLHLKDRKKGLNGGQNVPWGQGDTPIKDVLRLMRDQKYKFPAFIELEYPVPPGSTRAAEIGKCLQFCKDALA